MGGWKNATLVYNFILWVTGLAVIGSGAYIQVGDLQIRYGNYIPSLGTVLSYLPLMIIFVGSAAAVMTFFGCLGSLRDNQTMIVLYAATLAIACGIQIAGVAAFFHYRHELSSVIRHEATESLKMYGQIDYQSVTDGWNRLQMDFGCCGVDSYEDWERAIAYQGNKDLVPDSCCHKAIPGCGRLVRTSKPEVYEKISIEGCFLQLINFLEGKYLIFALVAGGFAVLLLIGTILTIILSCKLKQKSRGK